MGRGVQLACPSLLAFLADGGCVEGRGQGGHGCRYLQLHDRAYTMETVIGARTWTICSSMTQAVTPCRPPLLHQSGGRGEGLWPPAHFPDQAMPRSTHLHRPGLSGSPESSAVLSVTCVEMKERIDAARVGDPG